MQGRTLFPLFCLLIRLELANFANSKKPNRGPLTRLARMRKTEERGPFLIVSTLPQSLFVSFIILYSAMEQKTALLRTALVQISCSDSPVANRENIVRRVTEAAAKGARLVVLQELHETRYFCQTEDVNNFNLAHNIPGEATDFYGSVAQEAGVVLVTSLFEKRATGLYHNTAVVFEADGSIAGTFRKKHIPDDPAYYEKFYFTPGDDAWRPINTSVGRLGVQVCWDQWYPEGARLMALAGADLLIYPTTIGYSADDTPEEQQRQREAWRTIQRGHAVANGLPVIAVNRTGFEPDPSGHTAGIRFWGSSFVCGPQGEILTEAGEDEECVLMADIDLGRSEQVRRWWPFLRDRRIDRYEDLTQRYLD